LPYQETLTVFGNLEATPIITPCWWRCWSILGTSG